MQVVYILPITSTSVIHLNYHMVIKIVNHYFSTIKGNVFISVKCVP